MNDQLDVTLCVDAIEPQLGGIGRYTWELSQRLPAYPDIKALRYLARHRLIDDPSALLRGAKISRGRGILRAVKRVRAKKALRSTIVHGPNYFLPVGTETGVVTVHDLSVFRYPETHPSARVDQFERQFVDSVRRAAHVITDTETVRSELIKMFDIPPAKVTAVALGAASLFRPHKESELGPALRRFGLSAKGYGLSVSALEPRKKLPHLLAAWRRLPRTVREAFPLVLAGGNGWMNEQLHEQIADGLSEGWLAHLGHVRESDLAVLYAGAALFIYPSIYEGFGLPPVEAMASGVPVIVANRSCLPEVCGDAPRYVDPDDDNDFLTAIVECLANSDWQKKAITRGLERAARYTWDRCLQDTVAIYRSVKSG